MLEPPPEAVHASLEEGEATLIEHVRSQGFAVTRTRTNKSKTGVTHKVCFGCAHGGAYKNRRDYLTEELGNARRPPGLQDVRNGENDENDAAAAPAYNWTTTVEVAGHNHGEAEILSVYPSLRELDNNQKRTTRTCQRRALRQR
ncbi:hypothetical protein PsorP6_017761 [Peronosclerospora sorghi]|uniref:Uncharacterized protein n=1 Tax=Peronosclerospora sorghi TaxID=230839 RepID=A0ACC0WLF6_9STRA|nr:hypothetical protein PsorP6_017761 [Peronosclerospora sorghi]